MPPVSVNMQARLTKTFFPLFVYIITLMLILYDLIVMRIPTAMATPAKETLQYTMNGSGK